jgi:hypothetical protein
MRDDKLIKYLQLLEDSFNKALITNNIVSSKFLSA